MNGWHWEERNMMGWSRDKLTQLLVGLVADISPEQGAAQLTELKDLKGEVSVGACTAPPLSAPAACTAPLPSLPKWLWPIVQLHTSHT